MTFLAGLVLGWLIPRTVQVIKDEVEGRRIDEAVRRSNAAWGIPEWHNTRQDRRTALQTWVDAA